MKRKRIRSAWSALLGVVLLTTMVCVARAGEVEPPMGSPGSNEVGPSSPYHRWAWNRGGSFQALDFPRSAVGWMGGELLVRGFKSPEGDWSWVQMAPRLTDRRSIKALDFHDERYGCALGSDDTFLYTAEKGIEWLVKALPVGVSELTAVYMTGPESVYAVGRSDDLNPKGVVLHSEDAGDTWRVLYTTTNEAWLTDLVFFPDGHGLVIGYDWTQIGGYTGRVLSVDDAGGAVIYSQYRLFLRALSAPSENHVYVAAYEDHPLGDPAGGAVLYTHSGGGSWSYVALPEDDAHVEPYDIFFPTPTQGWVVATAGEEGLLFKSADSGVTWSPHVNFAERSEHLSALDLVGGPDSATLFAAQSAGYAAFPCNGGCPGVVVGSTDGGASWQRVEVLSGIWSQELALVPGYIIDQALLLGRFGDDDSYLPYSPLRYPAGLRLRAEGWLSPFAMPANVAENFVDWRGLDLGDRDSGWATADHWEKEGKTWHTSDQGDSWTQQTTPVSSGAGDLTAINSVRAWAVDYVVQWGTSTWQYVSRLLTTSDGGDHWEEADVPLAAYGPDANRDARVTAVDANHGCVLNEPYGAVKCTSDGWSSYTSQSLGCWGLDVAMWDQDRAWALCYDLEEDVFEVWRTTDGGESWTLKSDIDPAEVSENEDDYTLYGHGSALTLQAGPRGWFAHHNIWETDDGGSSWERAFDGIHPELGISLLETTPSGMGWAATPSGTVLRWAPLGIQMVLVQGGGQLPAPDGGPFIFIFPEGAVVTDTLASVIAYQPGPAGDYFATSVYELTLASGAELAAPITLTTVITPLASVAQASGAQEEPVLAQWEASNWTPLEDSTYGPDGRLTATTQEAGFFGVLIPQKRVYLPLVLR